MHFLLPGLLIPAWLLQMGAFMKWRRRWLRRKGGDHVDALNDLPIQAFVRGGALIVLVVLFVLYEWIADQFGLQ